jgi:hypothetical protein
VIWKFLDFWTDLHRSDQFCLPVRPVWTYLIQFELPKIDLMSPTRARPPHPIYTGCHGWLRATNPIETNHNFHTLILSTSTLVLPLSTPNYVLTLICCSSFIPTVIEGILASLPMLEHTKALLPRWGPSRAGVHWIFVVTRENRSDRLPIPLWPIGWSRGRSGSFVAHARAGASVCDQISRQH